MAMCDLCGRRDDATNMQRLLEQYRTDGVVDLCRSCIDDANKEKRRLVDDIAPRMKDWVRSTHHKYHQTANAAPGGFQRPWWAFWRRA